jgi:hypothetical protein
MKVYFIFETRGIKYICFLINIHSTKFEIEHLNLFRFF